MPQKRDVGVRKLKSLKKMTSSSVRKRLMELKIMLQDYMNRNKPIYHDEANMFLEEIISYEEQFDDYDILQVIGRLKLYLNAILTGEDAEMKFSTITMPPVYSEIEEGNIECNIDINDENETSPTYSETYVRIITFNENNNTLSPDYEKTKEIIDTCDLSEGSNNVSSIEKTPNDLSNKETENINTIKESSKDYDFSNEFSLSILSGYHSNITNDFGVNTINNKCDVIANTINNKSEEIAINDQLKTKKNTNTVTAEDDTQCTIQNILPQTAAPTTTNKRRRSKSTSNQSAKKTNEIITQAVMEVLRQTGLLELKNTLGCSKFKLMNVKENAETSVNNISQTKRKRKTKENKMKMNNTKMSFVHNNSDNKTSKTYVKKNDSNIIKNTVVQSNEETLLNENDVNIYTLEKTKETQDTQNINTFLETNETELSGNFAIPKPPDMNIKPKAPRKKPTKTIKDKNTVSKRVVKINEENKKRKIELSDNSFATSPASQESNTFSDLSIINQDLSISLNNRPTKHDEFTTGDLSWIENVKYVRIINEEEYDPTIDSDSIWKDLIF